MENNTSLINHFWRALFKSVENFFVGISPSHNGKSYKVVEKLLYVSNMSMCERK